MAHESPTDAMCRCALDGWARAWDRIVGYSTPREGRGKWGAPYFVKDEVLNVELWRGDSHDEMLDRCEMEKMRLALSAVLSNEKR